MGKNIITKTKSKNKLVKCKRKKKNRKSDVSVIKSKISEDSIGNGDDTEPLVQHKIDKTKKREPKRKLNVGKKSSKNNSKTKKKIFHQSDSESEDFEKYTYFDENKSKRKIKLDPKLSIEELENQIRDIKIENACLMKEHNRIDEIKLNERLKMRSEIGRLKSLIIELKINGVLTDKRIPDIGNTSNLISAMKKVCEDLDSNSLCADQRLNDKIKSLELTNLNFWQEFNSIETNSDGINPLPFWTGSLEHIHPNHSDYYKPEHSVEPDTKLVIDLDNKYNSYLNPTDTMKVKDSTESDKGFSSDDSTESFGYNGDWNELATRRRIKKSKLNHMEENVKTESNEIFCDNASDIESDLENEDLNVDKDAVNAEEANVKNESINEIKDVAEEDPSTLEDMCTECGFDSSWSLFIVRHREAYQNGSKLTPCNTCNMKFLKSGHFDGKHQLKRSLRKIDKIRPKQYICDTCGQGCATSSGLSQHRLRHQDAQYPCPHCSYKCRRRSYMKKHIEIHFKNSVAKNTDLNSDDQFTKFSCERCSFVLPSKFHLDEHVKYHENEHRSNSQ